MREQDYALVRDGIHDAIMRGIDFSRSVEDEEVLGLIDEEIIRAKREGELSLDEMKQMRMELFNAIRRLDVLQDRDGGKLLLRIPVQDLVHYPKIKFAVHVSSFSQTAV